VRDIAVDLNGMVYAATDVGLWVGDEDVWTKIGGIPSDDITALTIDSSGNPEVIYAGTGDLGVFVSSNGGGSWNSFNEGLFILPIDRFIFGLEDIDSVALIGKLKKYFDITELSSVDEMISILDNTQIMIDKSVNLKNHVFGMYLDKPYLLKLKVKNILDDYYPDKSDVYRKLDVNILHRIAFEQILGISEEDQFKGTHIDYTKGSKRALENLKKDKYQLAFFINPPLMREIFLTARQGETMPQKSTYFYPKVYSGLVINKISR
jgi:uncharacterized protein (DUF1015 family)